MKVTIETGSAGKLEVSPTQESIEQFGSGVLRSIEFAEKMQGGADPDNPVYDQH